MDLVLQVWRQANATAEGRFVRYEANDISEHASFLEMLDIVNERLVAQGDEPIAFEHDCREGICGCCSLVIDGIPHGPQHGAATCQLHMRHYRHGQEVWIEPWRAKAFPVLRDLVVDRSAFDRIMQVGGYVSVRTGSVPDANAIPIRKEAADLAMDAASCIGCGACVAACPNASAMLFVSAKVSHLGLLPQGQPERRERVLRMVARMDEEGFGTCTNHGECEAVCPKQISIDFIARLNRDLFGASLAASGADRPTGGE